MNRSAIFIFLVLTLWGCSPRSPRKVARDHWLHKANVCVEALDTSTTAVYQFDAPGEVAARISEQLTKRLKKHGATINPVWLCDYTVKGRIVAINGGGSGKSGRAATNRPRVSISAVVYDSAGTAAWRIERERANVIGSSVERCADALAADISDAMASMPPAVH